MFVKFYGKYMYVIYVCNICMYVIVVRQRRATSETKINIFTLWGGGVA
jgi:hypothetical protein